jgi:hypothetical protein
MPAAFAASVAMLGCPVGGALAAATQVDVVNPATSPALTRSVDDPGRIAYQSTATCVQDSAVKNACFFDFPAVPRNHRLVVQHISASLLGSAPKGAQVNLSGGANQAASSFLAPPSFQGASEFDQLVLQYFDGGSTPFLQAVADTTLTSGSATIFGYLLDCATTPCAAIAQ